jgi:hypothetical protein
MLILGLLLIALSVVALIIGAQGADNEFVNEQLTSLLCDPEERLTEVSSASNTGQGNNTSFYCEFSNGQRRDVTAGAVGIIAGAFLVPFLTGLFLVIGAGMGMAKRRVQEFTQTIMSTIPQEGGGVQTIDLRGGSTANIPPEAMERLQEVFGKLGMAFSTMGEMNRDDLTDRMEELKDALDKGLITPEEYESVRQRLLDNFSS